MQAQVTAEPVVRSVTTEHFAQLNTLYADDDGPSLASLVRLYEAGRAVAWVLECEAVLAGVCWLSPVLDEAELLDIRIAPSLRGGGLGRQLLQCSMQAMAERGATCCHLEVRRSNAVARALYVSLGFTEQGIRPNYYRRQDGVEDAILMSRPLT